MKKCRCGMNINMMQNYCYKCKENLSLREKFIEDLKWTDLSPKANGGRE